MVIFSLLYVFDYGHIKIINPVIKILQEYIALIRNIFSTNSKNFSVQFLKQDIPFVGKKIKRKVEQNYHGA